MLIRTLSAVLGIIILIAVMVSPDIVFDLVLLVISMIGMRELYSAFKAQKLKPIEWVGYLSIIIAFGLRYTGYSFNFTIIFLMIFLFMSSMYLYIIISKNNVNFVDISVTVFSVFYITFLLSFLSMTAHMQRGRIFVWFIFIGGWATDVFAYFFGKYMGRKKLIPDISPNKTIVGALAGIVGCTIVMFLYGLCLNYFFKLNIYGAYYILLGILTSIFAQFGDLVASAVKRTAQIKDFGGIMPGHGGIIDRFDSIFFVSPVVYFFLYFIS